MQTSTELNTFNQLVMWAIQKTPPAPPKAIIGYVDSLLSAGENFHNYIEAAFAILPQSKDGDGDTKTGKLWLEELFKKDRNKDFQTYKNYFRKVEDNLHIFTEQEIINLFSGTSFIQTMPEPHNKFFIETILDPHKAIKADYPDLLQRFLDWNLISADDACAYFRTALQYNANKCLDYLVEKYQDALITLLEETTNPEHYTQLKQSLFNQKPIPSHKILMALLEAAIQQNDLECVQEIFKQDPKLLNSEKPLYFMSQGGQKAQEEQRKQREQHEAKCAILIKKAWNQNKDIFQVIVENTEQAISCILEQMHQTCVGQDAYLKILQDLIPEQNKDNPFTKKNIKYALDNYLYRYLPVLAKFKYTDDGKKALGKALLECLNRRNYSYAKAILENMPESIPEQSDTSFNTILHFAMDVGDIDLVKLVLKKVDRDGDNVPKMEDRLFEMGNRFQTTPFHIAMRRQKIGLLALNHPYYKQYLPEILSCHNYRYETPIHLAARHKNWDLVIAIAKKYPTNPEDKANYAKALALAIADNHLAAVKALLDAKTPITPEVSKAAHGLCFPAIIRLLRLHGFQPLSSHKSHLIRRSEVALEALEERTPRYVSQEAYNEKINPLPTNMLSKVSINELVTLIQELVDLQTLKIRDLRQDGAFKYKIYAEKHPDSKDFQSDIYEKFKDACKHPFSLENQIPAINTSFEAFYPDFQLKNPELGKLMIEVIKPWLMGKLTSISSKEDWRIHSSEKFIENQITQIGTFFSSVIESFTSNSAPRNPDTVTPWVPGMPGHLQEIQAALKKVITSENPLVTSEDPLVIWEVFKEVVTLFNARTTDKRPGNRHPITHLFYCMTKQELTRPITEKSLELQLDDHISSATSNQTPLPTLAASAVSTESRVPVIHIDARGPLPEDARGPLPEELKPIYIPTSKQKSADQIVSKTPQESIIDRYNFGFWQHPSSPGGSTQETGTSQINGKGPG